MEPRHPDQRKSDDEQAPREGSQKAEPTQQDLMKKDVPRKSVDRALDDFDGDEA